MAGWLTVEEAEEQISTASNKYVNAADEGAEEYLLQDRFDELNEKYPTGGAWTDYTIYLNSSSAFNSKGDYIGEVYAGGNVMYGDGNGMSYNIAPDTLEWKIRDLFDQGSTPDIYAAGGPIPGAGQGFPDTTGYTTYCDSLVLAEASKITGEKWF